MDLFPFVLNIGGQKALQGEKVCRFWNQISSKGSEVRDQSLLQYDAAWYSRTNQRLMDHLVNDAGRVIYGILRVELDSWNG